MTDDNDEPEDVLTIGALAKRAGCSMDTIRFYERIGLMTLARRTKGNQRRYGREHIKRLIFIRRLRDLGFGSEGVREMIRVADGEALSCCEFRSLAQARLPDVQERMNDLRRLEGELKMLVGLCGGAARKECRVIEPTRATIIASPTSSHRAVRRA